MTLGLYKNCPTGFEAPQRIVEATGNGDKFGWHGAIEIRPPELCCPLKRAVLVEDNALIGEGSPRQEIG
jgi:hypothetical protein